MVLDGLMPRLRRLVGNRTYNPADFDDAFQTVLVYLIETEFPTYKPKHGGADPRGYHVPRAAALLA